MAARSWAMACIWLTLGQAPSSAPGQAVGQPSDVLVTNQRGLSIPVNIQDARRAEVRELLLFASTDQGRTWQQVAAMLPTQSSFTFTAPIDGTYWLRVAAINKDNKQEPDNLYQGQPDQKMVIDTMKPLLRLGTPQRQGDEVSLSWELQEDNPEWTTFRMEYQPKDGSAAVWTPIAATAGLTGQTRFRPTTPATIVVRLSFIDKAGNQAFTMVDVPGVGGLMAAGFNTPATNPTGNSTAAPPPPTFPGLPQTPLPTPMSPSSIVPPSLPATPLPIVETPMLPPLPAVEAQRALATPPTGVPAAQPTAPVWTPTGKDSNLKPDASKVVATSNSPPPLPSVPSAPSVPSGPTFTAPPRKTLPPLQQVNHPEVTLEYELARVGPSGIGSIDLWWTQNDGQTWELYAVDPEGKSGTVANGRHKRTVELTNGDGVYGFILVVKSKAGLGKAPPRAGEVPQIRVELDTSMPVAQLYAPMPEPQKPNTLLLRWDARDNNLVGTPIVLEWSAKRDGPWHAIAPPLANNGKHAWQLPDSLPVQVYLRLRVRDMAGNECIAVTAEPQLVDLSEPEGNLINVSVQPQR